MKKRRKQKLKKKLKEVMETFGPMVPGRLSEQYISCGKKNCSCQLQDQRKKHGPYHQFSWSISGKRSTMHVKNDEVEFVKKIIERQTLFQEILNELYLEEIKLLKKRKK